MEPQNAPGKRKSPSPIGLIGKVDLSKTLNNLPKEAWSEKLTRSYKDLSSVCKSESHPDVQNLAATFICRTIDPSTGKSCIEQGKLREILQAFEVLESAKKGAADGNTASGVDHGPAVQGQSTSSTNSYARPTQGPDKKSKDMSASSSAGQGIVQPKESHGSPMQSRYDKKAWDDPSVTRKEPSKMTDLSEKRAKELSELDEENKKLCTQIEKKDEQLLKLESAVKKLESEKDSINCKLEKAVSDVNDRQDTLALLERQVEESHSENLKLQSQITELSKAKEMSEREKVKMETCFKEASDREMKCQYNLKEYQKTLEKVFKDNKRKIDALQEDHETQIRLNNNRLADVIKEREDLKTRFSKLAGAKLTDQNADIADLSDPNRAMKVSEKFGQLYDDEWTDAFEELKKKKVDVKDAIQFLLRILQDCLAFCNNLKETQMDSLNNVLLHPSQNITKFAIEPRKNVGGFKEKARISSKDEKGVRALRRQIGVSNTCLEEVKQVFVMETKSWDKQGYDKKHLELCLPYLQKCAEICWLMVLHDPPLYMKMDAKSGDKMDSNLYTVYSSSGDKINYLVWPPLFNEAGGGLITKGVAEGLKTINKK